jgi:hypothetical protein
MTISKRKPAATPATVPAAKKPAAKTPVASRARRAAPAAASKVVVNSPVSPAPAIAAKSPPAPRHNEKRIRTSFALPESQVALLGELKKRCLGFGVNVKKGELMSAGLQLLKNLPETALEAAVLPSM